MTDLECINAYLEYARDIKSLSENTIKSYSTDLEYLKSYLSSRRLVLTEFSREDAMELIRVTSKKMSEASLLRHITCYRTFFSYLCRYGTVSSNPFGSISLRKKERHLPSVLSEEEVRQLLTIPYSDFMGLRDHILFLFLYTTGCRISEALSIDVKDIDWTNRRIRIIGKGSKERFIFLTKKSADEIRNSYLPERLKYLEGKKNAAEEALFIGESGNRLPFSSAHIIFDKYRERLGWQKEFTPHTLRHSFATHMMDRGADIRLVQEFLGHESISTTQIYTHVSKEHLRNVYAESHPHAKGK